MNEVPDEAFNGVNPQPEALRQMFEAWRGGDKAVLDSITPVLYDELRKIARFLLASERPDHTLQPTALVHEAYLRLLGQREVDWRNRAHFIGMAAHMMRRILINHAEADRAAKRGGGARPIELRDGHGVLEAPAIEILALNRSLERLTALDPQQGRVVELRYFGGLSVEESAEVLGISPSTVKREWAIARLWLMRSIQGESPNSA